MLIVSGARAGIGESVIRLEAPLVPLLAYGARAGTRTRVQALATLGDNHYTTLASVTLGLDRGINRCRLEKDLIQASPNPPRPPSLSDPRIM